jgi:kynurenine formamidase
MNEPNTVVPLGELLRDAPKNWGRWGPNDEVGALNFLTAEEILRGVQCVRQGKAFTLQVPMCDPRGDPMSPGRQATQRYMVLDKGDFQAGKAPDLPGGLEWADDVVVAYLQGTTHYDALGHAWQGDQIWNGADATTTIGGLSHASVFPLADRGVVGRGVLLDVARHRGKDILGQGEIFSHADLVACAEAQGTTLQKRDILIVRTGWVKWFYSVGPDQAYADFREPGLAYSPELVQWFHDMEIPNLITDTTGNEVQVDPGTGGFWPLHVALLCYLGISLTEIAWLEDLADDCAADGQYDFLFAAAPLKVVGGSGGPVNPLAIK